MNEQEFNAFCEFFRAVTYVNQWGGAHVWKVGGKVFAIGGWSPSEGLSVSFKVSDHNFDVLRDRPGFRPAPYLASRGMKWIQQNDCTLRDELKYYIEQSYRIVSLGLTKKRQKELGLNQRADGAPADLGR